MSTLAEDYLAGRGGSPYEYGYNLTEGQRIGQAFFNAFGGTDQDRLTGTQYDPFYKNSSTPVQRAIEYLLDTE